MGARRGALASVGAVVIRRNSRTDWRRENRSSLSISPLITRSSFCDRLAAGAVELLDDDAEYKFANNIFGLMLVEPFVLH